MYNKSSRSSLFLMELIMSILFFSLAAAVCVQLFVQSHTLSKSSVELNHAVVECESLAELIYGTNGDPSLDGLSVWNGDTITYSYDKDFNKQYGDIPDSTYSLVCNRIIDSSKPGFVTYNISFTSQTDNKVIFSISPAYFIKGGTQ